MKKTLSMLGGTIILGTGGIMVGDAQVNPYEDLGTHYKLPIVSDIPQGEHVEIMKNKAEIHLRGWENEYNISIKPQIPTSLPVTQDFVVPANRPLLSRRMEYKSGAVTAFIEPVASTTNEFDIDFTLDSKPTTNVFQYVISGAEDFDFFYQPELTQQEIDEGAERPDNVVGSYAVYSKTKANHRVGATNYATGKIMHIYRPKAIDANGNWVWAVLDYTNGVLSVTVPQSFLDEAVYPVRVDPTIGYTSIGGSSATFVTNFAYKSGDAYAGSDGTLTDGFFYCSASSATAKIGIYDGSLNYVDDVAAFTVPPTGSEDWAGGVVTVGQTISVSSSYYLFFRVSATTRFWYDSASATAQYKSLSNGAAWPATFSGLTNDTAKKVSLYFNYTASGGTPTVDQDYSAVIQW